VISRFAYCFVLLLDFLRDAGADFFTMQHCTLCRRLFCLRSCERQAGTAGSGSPMCVVCISRRDRDTI